MNPQPLASPPRWWPSMLNPRLVRLLTPLRNRDLRRQRILTVRARGAEQVRELLNRGHGVLIVSNHSFHYDSYTLIEAALRAGWFTHFLTAWQVFGMSTRFGQWMLQHHGCFSINREGTDVQAYKTAVSILAAGPHALVIYPEGDIYHSNDRIMPFREGAAAIALSAFKKGDRPISIVPAAMKCFYTSDPTPELAGMMDRLERHICWRPRGDLPLLERIYRFGGGFLALKEVEYLGQVQTGTVRERLISLALRILEQVRRRNSLPLIGDGVHERLRHLRSSLVKLVDEVRESDSATGTPEARRRLQDLRQDIADLFFVGQLSSYHGDYSAGKPTIERLAETIDKFEEDVFGLDYPTPRGTREAVVRFGESFAVEAPRPSAGELTRRLEGAVQSLLDELNREHETEKSR